MNYLSALTTSNDLSLTAHIGIASFIAAAREMMLETLQKAHDEKGLNYSSTGMGLWSQQLGCAIAEKSFLKRWSNEQT